MDITRLMNNIKQSPDYHKVGMILCHNGVVRGTSRDGKKVTGLKVLVDHTRLDQVIERHKKKEGIIDIQVEIAENKALAVGEDVMFLVVAGDIRENVIGTLNDTLNEIKTTVTTKEEFFV